jgi:ABC-type sulfate transport system permease component
VITAAWRAVKANLFPTPLMTIAMIALAIGLTLNAISWTTDDTPLPVSLGAIFFCALSVALNVINGKVRDIVSRAEESSE